MPDFDEEEEFKPVDQGDYRRTSATELIRTYEWETNALWAILGAFLMVALRDIGIKTNWYPHSPFQIVPSVGEKALM